MTAPTIAKIARPSLSAVYPRVRLFRALDHARKFPLVWISAPAGAGKTTLVASYLERKRLPVLWYQMDATDNDPASFFYFMGLAAKATAPRHKRPLPFLTAEYLSGLKTFSANFFRSLFERLSSPVVVVLDNFQEVAPNAILQDVLCHGFEQIPPGINVVILSREEPPGIFARARASNRIARLKWDDLRLTEKETAAVLRLRYRGTQTATALAAHVHRKTHGWMAGVVLLSEQNSNVEFRASETLTENDNQTIFDYFANEIFLRANTTTQEFFLKTSFLPKISPPVARALSDDADAEAILYDVTQRNYFTVRHANGSYQYHPLFRAFLVGRANAVYTAEEIRALKQRTAQVLAKEGDIESGIGLLQEAKDWPAALDLVLAQAQTLQSQGRTKTIETWLMEFPEMYRHQNPWVLYWLGVCRSAVSIQGGRPYLEQAFALFEQQNEATPLYLTWIRIIETYFMEWYGIVPLRKWVDVYPTLSKNRVPPHPAVEEHSVFTYLLGLNLARGDHPDLSRYAERAELLFNNDPDPRRRLARVSIMGLHYMWRGEFAKTRALMDSLASYVASREAGPHERLFWYFTWGNYTGLIGDAKEALRATTEGLAIIEAFGIHTLEVRLLTYGVWNQFCVGNIAAIRWMLERLDSIKRSAETKTASIYRRDSFIPAFLDGGDVIRARDDVREWCEDMKRNGMPDAAFTALLFLASASARAGDRETALACVEEARALGIRMRCKLFEYFSAFSEAHARFLFGEEALCLQALRQALALGHEMGTVTPSWCLRPEAAALYAIALDGNIHTDYVRTVIEKTALTPPPGLTSERWPWLIRLYTLGRFMVLRNNRPLVFSVKAQKKPLELLRAVILFGGREVSAAKVARLLWPEADSGMAERTLGTTLYRLRKLVGDKTVLLNGGFLSLNPEYCWLDVWAFDALTDEKRNSPTLDARQLLDLYRGPFLEGDNVPLVLNQRDRLRSRFLRLLLQLAEEQEAKGAYDDAADLYRQGLEAEPFAEKLYYGLMQCYLRLNRPTDVIATYRRCATTLKSLLNTEPSAGIKAIFLACQKDVHSSANGG